MADVAGSTLEAIARYAPVIDVPPPAVLDQARRNIEAQVALLQEFGAVTAEKLAELAGSKARRASTTVENWRRGRRVLAVRWHDELLVPGFLLLADGQPNPAARAALSVLADQGFSDWQAALWWAVPAPALAGRRPVDVLLAGGDKQPAPAELAEQLAAAAVRRKGLVLSVRPPVGLSLPLRNVPAGTNLTRVAIDNLSTTEPSTSSAPRRFSPVRDATDQVVPVLYAGDSLACALGETVFHDLTDDPAVPATIFRADLLTLGAGTMRLARSLELVDLTDAALGVLELARTDVVDTPPADYPVTASWGQAAWDTTLASGLLWNSRRNPDALSYLLFVDPPRRSDTVRAVNRRDDLLVVSAPIPLHDGDGLGAVLTAASDRNVTVAF